MRGRRLNRWRPRLPVAPLRGRYLISEAAVEATERLLPTYRGMDGDHEGIVYLCGREFGDITVLTTAIAPSCDHGRGYVMCSEGDVDRVTTAAHARHLGVLAQVHTHPGGLIEHSQGDDTMVLMPFDGMLSIVVPHYGRHGMRPLHHMGVHQHRGGGWVSVEPDSVCGGITIVAAGIDLR